MTERNEQGQNNIRGQSLEALAESLVKEILADRIVGNSDIPAEDRALYGVRLVEGLIGQTLSIAEPRPIEGETTGATLIDNTERAA